MIVVSVYVKSDDQLLVHSVWRNKSKSTALIEKELTVKEKQVNEVVLRLEKLGLTLKGL